MDMNAKSEAEKLKIKRELIKKLDLLLAATGELRAQTEEMGILLEEAHRFPKAA